MRYPYKPKDLVLLGGKILEVMNMYGDGKYLGKYIKLRDRLGNTVNRKISEVEILKYRGGLSYVTY